MTVDLDTAEHADANHLNSLFALQTHCALASLLLGGIWIAAVLHFYDSPFKPGGAMTIVAGVLLVLFLVVGGISNQFSTRVVNGLTKPAKALPWLRLCSISCVLGISLLIWLSGGVNSPLTPFYVMSFTLTLENISRKTNKLYVFLLFVIPVVIACIAAYKTSLVNSGTIELIQKSDGHSLATGAGIVFSMAVPTISAWWIQRSPLAKRALAGEDVRPVF
jgi:hypothetical protein